MALLSYTCVILGDRGEMESKNADNLVSMLGVRIENAPPYRADLKGIIEQHFRTINSNATVFLPGRVKPDMAEPWWEGLPAWMRNWISGSLPPLLLNACFITITVIIWNLLRKVAG